MTFDLVDASGMRRTRVAIDALVSAGWTGRDP